MSNFTWLHFSDLHFDAKGFADESIVRTTLNEYLKKKKFNPTYVFITGDIANKCDYNGVDDNIKDLLSSVDISDRLEYDKYLFWAAGNHDIKRNDNSLRTENIRNIIRKRENGSNTEYEKLMQDDEYIQIFKISGMSEYYKNYEKIFEKKFTDDEKKKAHRYVELPDLNLVILNTSLTSCDDNDSCNLFIMEKQVVEMMSKLNLEKPVFVMGHHGISFFDQREQFRLAGLFDGRVDVYLCGHSHRLGYSRFDDAGMEIHQFTCGGGISNDSYSKLSFLYGEYNDSEKSIVVTPHSYSEKGNLDWNQDFSLHRRLTKSSKFVLSRLVGKLSNNQNINSSEIEKLNVQGSFEFFGIEKALTPAAFFEYRRELCKSINGEISIAGQSLFNAFSTKSDSIESIYNIIKGNMNIDRFNILVTDPAMFDSYEKIELPDTPIDRIRKTIDTILSNQFLTSLGKHCKINIYFIPLVQLDHIVVAEDILMLRSTLLWTADNEYKATPFICRNVPNGTTYDGYQSMYAIYKNYIDKLMDDSIEIDVEDINVPNTKSKELHNTWRKRTLQIRKNNSICNVTLHKLYRKQLISDLHSSWGYELRNYSLNKHWEYAVDDELIFKKGQLTSIKNSQCLYNAQNLLNDPTQEILLKYTKETEGILDRLMKKYDKPDKNNVEPKKMGGAARIFPSLDIGFPNNIQRLAGGFATGMLVVWKCGTPIVPIDTTVNVCSSTYSRLVRSNVDDLKLQDFFNKEKIDKIINEASRTKGMSFSFDTGNHFLLFCKSKKTNDYYLILHSSARQFKDSYIGLYPSKNNWYSNDIKIFKDDVTGRNMRYLKDKAAEHFIQIARNLNNQNEHIHEWFVSEFVSSKYNKNYSIALDGDVFTRHHYGMPTDYSVAIGTYVLSDRQGFGMDVVPIFTRKDYPIIMFRPDSDMWGIVLDGKKKYLVPHGWGQKLTDSYIKSISPDFESGKFSITNDSGKMNFMYDREKVSSYQVDEFGRFDRTMVTVRTLEDFNDISKKYLKGEVMDVLIPIALYSRETKCEPHGVKYYFDENGKVGNIQLM